ncbi:hypothetical protein EBO34_16380 [Alteribacter keqinensis]|uniref:YheC/YheD family protein n=2 Tax=Alteribacter keqinensis TaxID=2483800 RepID=A0A3M7TMM0_9BACI|nr:hypothetical protein EBO34_16380 [Alteribacter keqinensis]
MRQRGRQMFSIWIKIRNVECEKSDVQLPRKFDHLLSHLAYVQHGLLTQPCKFKIRDVEEEEKGTRESPLMIEMPRSMIKSLYIIEDLPFQAIVIGSTLKIGPVTGVIVDKSDRVSGTARKEITHVIGGILVFLNRKSINLVNKTVAGKVYDHKNRVWIGRTVPLPEVIYVRGTLKKYRHLLLDEYRRMGGILFNTRRHDKYEIEHHLGGIIELKDAFITSTLIENADSVIHFLKDKKKVVLKPSKSKRGKGVIFIEEKDTDIYQIYDYRKTRKARQQVVSHQELQTYLNQLATRKRYIMQEWISFLQYRGAPFDMRVHMQKDEGSWICNGIECRVARAGEKITNVSKGGKAISFSQAMGNCSEETRDMVKERILHFCDMFCTHLDQALPDDHFADVGMDIGLEKDYTIRFIEVNFSPAFKGFRRFNRLMYKKISWQPLLYAAQCQGYIK